MFKTTLFFFFNTTLGSSWGEWQISCSASFCLQLSIHGCHGHAACLRFSAVCWSHHFCCRNLHLLFLSICISSCMTRSCGAQSWPSLYTHPGKGKGTFYKLVLSISSSPKNGWPHAEKARRYSQNSTAVSYFQFCNTRCNQLVASIFSSWFLSK